MKRFFATMFSLIALTAVATAFLVGEASAQTYPVGEMIRPGAGDEGMVLPPPSPLPLFPGWNADLLIGWAATPDQARLSLDTKGIDLFNMVGEDTHLPLSGMWMGGSGQLWLNPELVFQCDMSSLMTPDPGSAANKATMARGRTGARTFRAVPHWWQMDSGAAWFVRPNMAVRFGLHVERLDTMLVHPTPGVELFSNPADEGEMTYTVVNPYIGGQLTFGSPAQEVMLRVAGFPWVYNKFTYRMTFGDSRQPSYDPIRDDSSSNLGSGYSVELSGRAVLRRPIPYTFSVAGLGAFGKMSLLGMSGNADFEANDCCGHALNEKFKMDFSRLSLVFGGFLNVSFRSPI